MMCHYRCNILSGILQGYLRKIVFAIFCSFSVAFTCSSLQVDSVSRSLLKRRKMCRNVPCYFTLYNICKGSEVIFFVCLFFYHPMDVRCKRCISHWNIINTALLKKFAWRFHMKTIAKWHRIRLIGCCKIWLHFHGWPLNLRNDKLSTQNSHRRIYDRKIAIDRQLEHIADILVTYLITVAQN